MDTGLRVSRRTFLKIGAAAGGGLLIGFDVSQGARLARAAGAESEAPFAPNAWIRIAADGTVTVSVGSSEMGEGTMTSIPMLAAEELDADWSHVRAEFAPAKKAYTNPIIGQQLTGGSSAVRAFWHPVREAGATGRAMLVAAAARRWGVPEDSCDTEPHAVVHRESGRRAGYGELAAAAAEVPVPETVFLKEPSEFRIIGTPRPRLDVPDKVDGSARFGLDVQVEGMKIATVVRCPVFGGKVKSFDAGAARKIKGVRAVMEIDGRVAVVADHFWAARQGAKALRIEWDEGPHAKLSSAGISQQFRDAVDGGARARHRGDPEQALKGANRIVEAEYEVPYLAHACMEPMNCTAHVQKDRCDVWVPTQAQTKTQNTAMEITGLPREKVHVHTTFLGGGFGRRSEIDFVDDAVRLSKAVGAPVKVLWTREETTQHDYYRPAAFSRLRGGINSRGQPVAWVHRIAAPSISARTRPDAIKNGIDNSSVEGAADLPYDIPALDVTYAMVNPGVPVGYWRSVGHSQNAFVVECFLDELAAAGGQDPFELRRRLLQKRPRELGVLELAAEKAGWGKPLPPGLHRGIAVARSFGSWAAEVAEVSVENDEIRVHRVVSAIDCGQVVNPDTVEAQMQSGIVYGLTAALKGEITLENGRVQQSNFHDYQMLRMNEMPEVEVHIVQSDADPSGVGEPGTPPIAPAVANAVFAATGTPVRRLPIRLGKAGS